MFEITMNAADRQILRRLANQVAELAARPVEAEKRELWYRHNDLEATRPVVMCDPENGWNEIITQDSLACTGGLARFWEMSLKREIFWGTQLSDDRVLTADFKVPHVWEETDWGLQEHRIGGQEGGAYTWEPPIKDYSELARLHFPRIVVDYPATDRLVALAGETFGDILNVRLYTSSGIPVSVWWTATPPPNTVWWWSFGMTETMVKLRGLAQMMYDMVDCPDKIHQLMRILRDGSLAKLDYLEQNGLLSLNNDATYVGSGGYGWTHRLPQPDFAGHVRASDMWGFAESQETVGVSPRMFEEFVYPYQRPILERFGLNCYGCCEPLDKRWEVVAKIPRLRRVSVSAWASVDAMAERLGDQYIFSWKPSPADLAMATFDEDLVRNKLRYTMQRAKNCRLEVIMKDNHTIRNDPQRVVRWVQIAREEAEAV
jgi:hypothetical protein